MPNIGELEHLLAGVVAEWHEARECKRVAVKAHNECIAEIEVRMEALLAQLRDMATGQGVLFEVVEQRSTARGALDAVEPHPRIFAAADEEETGGRMCAECGQFKPRTGALTCARCAELSGHPLDARDPGYKPTTG